MDKSNKKQTDLLAAGRKKLEQFRQKQKKDGKGGKSSGKTKKSEQTGKSEQEAVLAAEMLEKDNSIGPVAAASSELDTSKGVVPIDNDGANDHQSSKDGIIESTSSEPVASQDKLPERESNELQDNSETIASGENSAIPDIREQVDIRSEGERPKGEEQQVTDIGAMQKSGGNSAEQDDTISEIRIESVSNVGGNIEMKDPIGYVGEIREDAHISPAAAAGGAASVDLREHSACGHPSSEAEGTINIISKVEDDEANGTGFFSEETAQKDQGDGREDASGSNLEYAVDNSVRTPSEECTVLTLSSASGVFPVSLSQLAEVIQRLDDNAFRVLLDSRHAITEKVSTTPSTSTTDIAFVEAFEKLKDHLYLESCAKDALQIQLAEQLEEKMLLQQQLQKLGRDLSIASASLVQSQGNNETISKNLALCRSELVKVVSEKEELQNQLHGSKCQLDEHIIKINKLQNELDTLQENLVKVSSELDGRRNAELHLLTETERLSSRLGFLNEEKNEVVNENMKIMSELDHYKTSLTSLQLEKESLAKNLALLAEEKKQFDEENKFLIQENNMLHSDLTDCKRMVVALQVERTYLNEVLAVVKEDKEYTEDSADTRGIGESETTVKILEKSSLGGSVAIKPKPQQLQLSDVEGLSEFNSWRRSKDDAGEVFQKLEKAIEILHSHSPSLNRTVTPVAPAVSKLIQAFELKTPTEEQETSDLLSSETLNTSNAYMLTKEQMKNLKVILDEMFLQMENAYKFLAVEKKSRLLAEETVAEVQASYEYLRSHSDLLEEEMIEQVVLCESLRQCIYDSAATVSDLVVLCEASQKQQYDLSSENCQLRGKVSGICAKIGEFQDHLDEICQSADEMVSSVSSQVEILLKEVTDTGSLLVDEWNSFVAQVIEALGELEASIEPLRSYDFLTGLDTINSVGKRLVGSINGTKRVVETLQGELKAVQKNHDVALSNYSELYKHFNSLKDENEKAISMLLMIYRNLRQFVIVFCESAEGLNSDLEHEKLLDPLDSSVFDVLMEKLGGFADEKNLLESVNNKLKSELVDHSREINELKRRSLDSDTILRLFEDAERAFKLDSFDVQTYEPQSCLASLINILIQKYKDAEHQMSTLAEMHANSVAAELNDLTLWLIEFDIQNTVLKDGWKIVSDNIPALRGQLFEKMSELEQSEQRVSSLRDKLGMAVTKGKGLVAQRDSLKQSLAEASSQLEQCSQELHSKDVRIHELEMKLENYSEAGERMEALESELSYIRNSATALRESFLLKDSVLQRIEEILEDLELPEHFHSGGLIEKVDWLAKSVTRNTNPPTEWFQRSAFGGESVSDGGFVMDGWREETSLSQNSVDELRRRYDELQSKFYGLAEQNEMLEQSLMESNNLVQRWEIGFDKLNIPSQLKFSEPEDRMQWLGTALSEAQDSCISLQQRVDYLNTLCESLNGDFDASRKKIEEQKFAYESLTSENEGMVKNLETLNSQYDETLQKVTELEKDNKSLLKEVGLLQERLGKEHEHAERIRQIEGELIRLQSEIKVALQYSDANDSDFGSDSMECLERLLIKLIEEYKALALMKPVNVDASDVQANEEECHPHLEGSNRNSSIDGAIDVAELHKNLEEALSEATQLKEERERYKENNQALICQVEELDLKKKELLEHFNEEEQKSASLREKLNMALSEVTHLEEERERYKENNQALIREVEELDLKKKELLELFNQEEQKSASLREKLNMAVKKGKSLVQQRDNLKQNIEELNSEIAHLKSQLSIRDTTIADYELRISNMSINLQRIEAAESECLIVKDRLAETELILHEREHMLSMMLNVLKDIDVHTANNSENPVEKLQEIGKRCHELQSALDSCNKDLKKSREAADLLFAELNEVQERNDSLQEELAHVIRNHSEISREVLSAESAKSEALSELQKISAAQSKEREDHFAEVTALKSYVNQVKEDMAVIDELVSDVLTNNMEILGNLAAIAKSCVGSALSPDIDVAQFSISGGMISNKFENKMFVTELGSLKEKLCSHDKLSYSEANRIAEVVHSIHKEVASIRQASGARESHLMQLEAMLKEKDSELFALRRNISLLYEACAVSFMDIEKWKAQQLADEDSSNLKIHTSVDQETDLASEENVRVVTEKLILVVKNLISMKNGSAFDSHKEMKTLIANLQKELHEKDIQSDRISMELVTQIKESESAAKKYLQDLQSAKAQVEHLRSQLILMEEERKTLEIRVEELKNMEAILQELQQRFPLLTDSLASKEEENEALMRALDEEETQMEEMTLKIGELEKALKQKDNDLEKLQASRDKSVKKLSITVRKFDELHGFSESLLSEVEKLQSQLQEREEEISFLRQEVTRCTNESLTASQIVNKKNSDEVNELLTWLEMMISQAPVHDLPSDDAKNNQVDDRKQILEKQMTRIISEMEELRSVAQNKDVRVEELSRRTESLENLLRDKESQLIMQKGLSDSGQSTNAGSEIMEVESLVNKRAASGTIATQVRGARKANNDQVAIAIDMDPSGLEEEDDDKAHGFKSLTTSRIVPRFIRPVSDMIDGVWVSCDRALQRQPALRLGLIMYWAMIHALLAAFVV